MARPRTLGPTISFRLPVELHAIAEQRAKAREMTVAEYLASRVVDALSRQTDAAAAPTPRSDKVTPRWKAGMKL